MTHTTALSQPFANLCVLLLPLLIGNTQRFLHEDGNRLHEKTWGKYGDGSKPYPPVVHIKIGGIYGCSSP